MSLTVGTIASGIGGWEFGLERAGMRAVWHCEVEPFCQRVLRKHWPHNPIYGDANAQDWTEVEPVDVLAAGYPCQPFSVAGQRAGFDDERNLWPAVARAIRDIRPRYVLLENVRGHLSMGFGRVLGDLARLGYDAEWDVLAARDFGAPHKRERVWIVAHAVDGGRHERAERERLPDAESERPESGDVGCHAHATHAGVAWRGRSHAADNEWWRRAIAGEFEPDALAHTDRGQLREQQISKSGRVGAPLARRDGVPRAAADPNRTGREEQHPADPNRTGREWRPQRNGEPQAGREVSERHHAQRLALSEHEHPTPGEISERWREWHEQGAPPVSPVRGMDDGVSARLDRSALARLRRQDRPEWERVIARRRQPRARLKALGNALVPDIAEWIGRKVVEHAGAAC